MADANLSVAAKAAGTRRFLTFRMDERLYALPAEEVAEVIRVPAVAKVPQAPRSLMGVANLRGSVLPMASLRGLLGNGAMRAGASARALVLDGAAPVAVVVDAVDALVTVARDRVESEQSALAAHPGERLRGLFQADADTGVVKVLDIRALLAEAFVPRVRARPLQTGVAGAAVTANGLVKQQRLLTFAVMGREYALDLNAVREVIPAPETLAVMPYSESLVLGVMAYREALLPVLSLRGLLGFEPPGQLNGREKVVVTHTGGALVGLLADRMQAVVAVDPDLVEPPPSLLAARAGGESRIKAIYRGDHGRRLISILAPEHLFQEAVMQELAGRQRATSRPAGDAPGAVRDQARFLVFRLGDDEFGLPIEAIDEVAQVPQRITRVPNAPAFLEGVVNLRGEVLPVVDQRCRFGMATLGDFMRRRLVVVRTERHRAGLIVDSVSEVLQTAIDAIEQAPDLTGETTRLVNGVINLDRAGRMILVLDPAELLSRAERELLDGFDARAQRDDP